MENIEFLSKYWLLVGFLMIVWYIFRYLSRWVGAKETVFFSELQKIYTTSHRVYYVRHLLRLLCIACFFVIFAHPQKTLSEQSISKEGIDIVLILDISQSMLANDFSPDRFTVAQQVLQEFITQLTTDRLGLVVFAGQPFTSVPLTFDYEFVGQIVTDMSTDTINQQVGILQGTAIGDALLNGLGVLEKGIDTQTQENGSNTPLISLNEEREQVIILLTDGESTPRTLDPLVVAQLASEQQVKIYTVGIGSDEGGFITFQTPFGIQQQQVPGVDEITLREIAKITNANYRRATDEQNFQAIFDELSQLSKTEIETTTKTSYQSVRHPLGWVLLLCLVGLGMVEWKVE